MGGSVGKGRAFEVVGAAAFFAWSAAWAGAQDTIGVATEVRLSTGQAVFLPVAPGPQTMAVFGTPSLEPFSETVTVATRTAGIAGTSEAMVRSFAPGNANADYVLCKAISGVPLSEAAVGRLLSNVPTVRGAAASVSRTSSTTSASTTRAAPRRTSTTARARAPATAASASKTSSTTCSATTRAAEP